MNITKIELMNFRNYTKKTFDNFSNLNIIIGKNGIGKTSIIESIYLGSLAKSFKTNNELSIIKEGKDFFRIKVYYFDYGPKKNLEIFWTVMAEKDSKIDDKSFGNHMFGEFSGVFKFENLDFIGSLELKDKRKTF